ncbi:hypothetical protein GGR57DRAFT_473774 [Xylariaceae sp. FL1272]|nr:hypothetical protein GGR57DRAFT_473774 [Xylariaceae sp. FL1272]
MVYVQNIKSSNTCFRRFGLVFTYFSRVMINFVWFLRNNAPGMFEFLPVLYLILTVFAHLDIEKVVVGWCIYDCHE